MIVRKTNPSALVAAPEGSGVAVYAPLPEIHNTLTRHCATGPEAGDKLRHDLPDQARLVFVEFGRSGFAVPCLFQPFIHEPLNSQGGQ